MGLRSHSQGAFPPGGTSPTQGAFPPGGTSWLQPRASRSWRWSERGDTTHPPLRPKPPISTGWGNEGIWDRAMEGALLLPSRPLGTSQSHTAPRGLSAQRIAVPRAQAGGKGWALLPVPGCTPKLGAPQNQKAGAVCVFIPQLSSLPRMMHCTGNGPRSRAEGRFCSVYKMGSLQSLCSYSGHSSGPKGEKGVVRAPYRSPCAHVPAAHSLLEETWPGASLPRGGGHPAQPRSFLTPPQDLWISLETREVVTHALGHIPTPHPHPCGHHQALAESILTPNRGGKPSAPRPW